MAALVIAGMGPNMLHEPPMPKPAYRSKSKEEERLQADMGDAAKELSINFIAHKLVGNYGVALEAGQAFAENIGNQAVHGMQRVANKIDALLGSNLAERFIELTPVPDAHNFATLSLRKPHNSSTDNHVEGLMERVKKRGAARKFEPNTRQTPQLRR